MKIIVINGTEKHGVTYRLKEIFMERFSEKAEITVFTGKLMGDIVWEKLAPKKRSELTKKINRLSQRLSSINYEKPSRVNTITRIKFLFCRMMQKSLYKNDPEYLDGKYWAEQGWLGKTRPWRA